MTTIRECCHGVPTDTCPTCSPQCTKGPWVCAKRERPPPEIATVCHVGNWVVGVSTPGYPGGDYRNIDCPDPAGEADARLIAAAPELLEALTKLQSGIAQYLADPLRKKTCAHAEMFIEVCGEQVVKAIAKARGES